MAPKKKHRDSSPVYFNILSKGFYAKFVTEIDFYMKEILDENKSVCFIHLYPSIVQINRAKKLSDEPLKFSPLIFYGGVHRTVKCNSSSRLQAPLSVSFLSKLKDIYMF